MCEEGSCRLICFSKSLFGEGEHGVPVSSWAIKSTLSNSARFLPCEGKSEMLVSVDECANFYGSHISMID